MEQSSNKEKRTRKPVSPIVSMLRGLRNGTSTPELVVKQIEGMMFNSLVLPKELNGNMETSLDNGKHTIE